MAVFQGAKNVCISMAPESDRVLCFQISTIMQKGKVAIVFSPNLSRTKKEIEFLRSKKVNAGLLSKVTPMSKIKSIIRELTSVPPKITFLYINPDVGLRGDCHSIMTALKMSKALSYIIFNDAHRLSEFGYDYTPFYKNVFFLYQDYNIPRIAVTTTVTNKVLEDICKILKLENSNIFKELVQPANVYYDVWFVDNIIFPFEHLKKFITGKQNMLNIPADKGAGIVYCRKEKDAEFIKNELINFGVSAMAYHQKMKNTARRIIEKKWLLGEADVIVTNYDYEFIHKLPIRCIAYWTIPENIPKFHKESVQVQKIYARLDCRIYFSMKEYECIKYDIENQAILNCTERVKKQRLIELEKLVSYCLTAKCRHTIITRYFGNESTACNNNCDFCKDPETVNTRILKFLDSSNLDYMRNKHNICDINEDLEKEENTMNECKINTFNTISEILKAACSRHKIGQNINKSSAESNNDKRESKNIKQETDYAERRLIVKLTRLTTKDYPNLDKVKNALGRERADNLHAKLNKNVEQVQSLVNKCSMQVSKVLMEPYSPQKSQLNHISVKMGDTTGYHSETSKEQKVNKHTSSKDLSTAKTGKSSKAKRQRQRSVEIIYEKLQSPKRKKSDLVESTSLPGTYLNSNKSVECVDNKISSTSSAYATAKYLMRKYNLNENLVTLEPRKLLSKTKRN